MLNDEDDTRFLRKLGQSRNCDTSLSATLKTLNETITSPGAIRNTTQALFGLSPSVRDASALDAIHEALERNDEHGLLDALCANTSLPSLAACVDESDDGDARP
jgi:hypothetical protein